MFLCSSFRQRLKPVRVMRHTVFLCPVFHTGCHGICNGTIEMGTIVNHISELLEHVFRQVFLHFCTVKDVFTKVL